MKNKKYFTGLKKKAAKALCITTSFILFDCVSCFKCYIDMKPNQSELLSQLLNGHRLDWIWLCCGHLAGRIYGIQEKRLRVVSPISVIFDRRKQKTKVKS